VLLPGSVTEQMNINWSGVYGQEPTKEILSQLIQSSQIPHAFLFSGADGIGKYFLALRFAQNLNSHENSEKASFISNQILNLTEPFIKYVIPLPRGKNETDSSGPVEKLNPDEIQELKSELKKKIKNPYYRISLERANIIKISSIREIGKFLSLNYSDVQYRFILISDAHLMNEESQNALLKNLEEPPGGVIFILLTAYPDLLRETIRSRCWNINLQPLKNEEIYKILTEYFGVSENIAGDVSSFADGSATRAIELIENNFENIKEKTISFMRFSFGGKFNSALNEVSQYLSENDSASVKLLIKMIISWLNDILKYRLSVDNIYFKSHRETIEKFNKKFPEVELNEAIRNIDYLSSTVKNNVNLNTICLNLILELASITNKIRK
jgi:DNA polymerase III subunit delta'